MYSNSAYSGLSIKCIVVSIDLINRVGQIERGIPTIGLDYKVKHCLREP
jgi:hypothetical protein